MYPYAPGYAPPQRNPIGLTAIIASAVMASIGVGGFVVGFVRRRRADEEEEGNGKEGLGGTQPPPPPPRPPLTPPGGLAFKALETGGGAGQTDEEDIEIMMGGAHWDQFTSWFTRDVEREVINRLKGYRSLHKIENCTPVQTVTVDPTFGAVKRTKWLSHTEPATRQLLDKLYPNGAPWHGNQFLAVESYSDFVRQPDGSITTDATPPIALWRFWLWSRVMNLADEHVCEFFPET